MQEEQLTTEQIQVRNELMFKVWQDYKGRWTMKQIAKMFNCSLPYFYEILRKQRPNKITN